MTMIEWQSKMAAVVKKLEALHLDQPRVYGGWLAQTHYYVLQTLPYLKEAIQHCTSPHQAALRAALAKNAREEKGHDKLLLADLAKLKQTKAEHDMLETTRDFIEALKPRLRSNPFSILGRMLLLEGLAVQAGDAMAQRVRHAHGEGTSHFLDEHSDLDQDHHKALLDFLATLSTEDLAEVEASFDESVELYLAMLDAIA